jgi:hypothetical protein
MNVMRDGTLNNFVFQKAQAEGRLKEQQGAILSLREELKKPLYANAERKYLEKVVKKKVG